MSLTAAGSQNLGQHVSAKIIGSIVDGAVMAIILNHAEQATLVLDTLHAFGMCASYYEHRMFWLSIAT